MVEIKEWVNRNEAESRRMLMLNKVKMSADKIEMVNLFGVELSKRLLCKVERSPLYFNPKSHHKLFNRA